MNNRIDVDQVLSQMRALAAESQGAIKPNQDAGEVGFGDLLKQSINQVNETQHQAKEMTKAFELGQSDADLAQVMVAVQKSSLAFQTMVQGRNKLVEAYKDVMNMPV